MPPQRRGHHSHRPHRDHAGGDLGARRGSLRSRQPHAHLTGGLKLQHRVVRRCTHRRHQLIIRERAQPITVRKRLRDRILGPQLHHLLSLARWTVRNVAEGDAHLTSQPVRGCVEAGDQSVLVHIYENGDHASR